MMDANAGGNGSGSAGLGRRVACVVATTASLCVPATAFAQDFLVPTVQRGAGVSPNDALLVALLTGTVMGGTLFAYRLIKARQTLLEETRALRTRTADLARDNARLTTLADARDRRIVLWPSDSKDARPVLFGELPAETGAPPDRATFLGFGRWLQGHSAGLLEHALSELLEDGRPFDLTVETLSATALEVEGRVGGNGRFVRFQPAHISRRGETDLRVREQRSRAALDRIEALMGEIPHAAWTRDADGRLETANKAYAGLRGLPDGESVVYGESELFGEVARATISEQLQSAAAFSGRLSTTVDGQRRVFQVQETATPYGTAGIAVDVTEADGAEMALARTRRAHAEALDNLTTGVATFDADGKLVHWNAAFQRMWELDRGLLERAPSNRALLDHLRAEGKLAETPNWREWVDHTLEVYRSDEPREFEWTPPDGRTLHVVGAPQEGGGVTWLFEDMTGQHALASRATELQRIRDASLESLEEGIAVFGPDGRLRLANPAFGQLWSISEDVLREGAHVSAIAAACADSFDTPSKLWVEIVEDVTAIEDAREARTGQVRLAGDRTLSFSSMPLPRGQTMLTFVNVTDTVRVADALKARNEAMRRADQLKSAFLGHVSYELRSPLTNIIGFTDLMVAGAAGAVSPKQATYLDRWPAWG